MNIETMLKIAEATLLFSAVSALAVAVTGFFLARKWMSQIEQNRRNDPEG